MANNLGNLLVEFLPQSATKEEALQVLLRLCDEDFSGRNGEEYTSDKVLEKGYNSDAEDVFNMHIERGEMIIEAIRLTLSAQYEDAYYIDHRIDIKELNEVYIIATTYMS